MKKRMLHTTTPGFLVHGITRQQIEEQVLQAGTIYEDYARVTDILGQVWIRIKVLQAPGNAWLYDILPEDLA